MQTQWFYDKAFTDEQILWATYHELAHFFDFAEDHRAILGKFDDIQKNARETGSILGEKFSQANPQMDKDRVASYFEQKPLDPSNPERGTMNAFELRAYQIHHEFWNIMDDIYVNSLVERRKPTYGKGGIHQDEVTRLYREQLFRDSDFSKLPRHKQFIYTILRKDMVPDEEVSIRAEIQELFNHKYPIFGKEYTVFEIIKMIKSESTRGKKASMRYIVLENTLYPVFKKLLEQDIADWNEEMTEPDSSENEDSGKEKQNGDQEDRSEDQGSSGQEGTKQDQDTTGENGGENEQSEDSASQEDIDKEGQDAQWDGSDSQSENNDTQKNSNGSQQSDRSSDGGQGTENFDSSSKEKSFQENLDDTFNPSNQSSINNGPVMPRPVDNPEDIKKIIDEILKGRVEFKQQQEDKEKNKKPPTESTEERTDRLKAERDKKWCQEFDVDYETLQEYEAIEKKIKPYLATLDQLWQRIIYGQSRAQIIRDVGYFREGSDMDIDEAINEFPKILGGELDQVRIMTRDQTVREFVYRPELIRVRFIGDCSGSMTGDRREVLREAYVLLMTSLRRFESYLNLTRGRTKSNLSIDTEVWLFGSDADRVKTFRQQRNYQQERADIIRAFAQTDTGLGGTRDDIALSAINQSIDQGLETAIRSKKIMELVFELTDGGTNSKGINAAKSALNDLEAKGVIARAFQIGETNEDEQDIFQNIWNTDINGSSLKDSRGEIIGSQIENLIPALTKALAHYLSRIEL